MKKKLPKTATFKGRQYKVDVWEQIDGMCDCYSANDMHIRIMVDLNTRKGITTAIHEALHACNWVSKEDKVDAVSTDIGRFLWNLGYRHG